MDVNNNPVVDELERRFLPALQAMSYRLRNEFPHICINVWSSATGSATTDNPAHDLGIDCRFEFAPQDQADNVALLIGVVQVNDDPYLSELGVWWGAGSTDCCIGVDLLEHAIPWSIDAVNKIDASLPKLFETLVAALKNPPFPSKLT